MSRDWPRIDATLIAALDSWIQDQSRRVKAPETPNDAFRHVCTVQGMEVVLTKLKDERAAQEKRDGKRTVAT